MSDEEKLSYALIAKLHVEIANLQRGIVNLQAFWRGRNFSGIFLVGLLVELLFVMEVGHLSIDPVTAVSIILTIAIVAAIAQLGSSTFQLELKSEELRLRYQKLLRIEESLIAINLREMKRWNAVPAPSPPTDIAAEEDLRPVSA